MKHAEAPVDLEHETLSLSAEDRDPRVARFRVAVAAVAVLGVVGLLAVRPGHDDAGSRPNNRNAVISNGTDRTTGAAASAILAGMPSSPIDGRASWRLPVLAKPQHGLRDGDKITVYGRGFEPNDSVGIVLCSSEADTGSAGVAACQLGSGDGGSFGAVTYATASDEGNVVADVVVHRFITTPAGGQIDCRSAAERCLVAIGAVANYDRSGGSYLAFDGAPPFPQPTMATAPAGPYQPGQQVAAQVRSLVPGRSIRIRQCVGIVCQDLADGQADALGSADLAVVLQPAVVDPATGDEVPCDGRCVLRATGIGVKGASSAPLPHDVALAFTAPDPNAPVTTAPVSSTIVAGSSSTTTTGPPVTVAPPNTDLPVTTTTPTPPSQTEPDPLLPSG